MKKAGTLRCHCVVYWELSAERIGGTSAPDTKYILQAYENLARQKHDAPDASLLQSQSVG